MNTYLVTDLEATCCNDGSIPREEMEVIELSSVALDMKTLKTLGEFSSYVRPVKHPRLTDFCTELTGITNEQVDSAPTLDHVWDEFVLWSNQYKHTIFASWGFFDSKKLRHVLPGYKRHFDMNAINLKMEHGKIRNIRHGRGCGLKKALSHEGLEFVGRHHSGIDDARNIVRIVQAMHSTN